MTDEKKDHELTDFLKSIPEDPMPEEMWDEESAVLIEYDAYGNVLSVHYSDEYDNE